MKLRYVSILVVGLISACGSNKDQDCIALVNKIKNGEPGIDNVTNIKAVSPKFPELLQLPGKVQMTCTGDAHFIDGTKSSAHFFKSVSDNGEHIYFEPESIVKEFKEILEDEMDETITV